MNPLDPWDTAELAAGPKPGLPAYWEDTLDLVRGRMVTTINEAAWATFGQFVLLPDDPPRYVWVGQHRIDHALDLAVRYGGSREAHHLAWVVDQMVRALCGGGPLGRATPEYDRLVADACDGPVGPGSYRWDVGTSP